MLRYQEKVMMLVEKWIWNPIGIWQHVKRRVDFMPPHSNRKRELSISLLEAGLVDACYDPRKKSWCSWRKWIWSAVKGLKPD